MNSGATRRWNNDPIRRKSATLILVLCVLVIAISSRAAGDKKLTFQEAGIHAGMTKAEVTSILTKREVHTRYELSRCTSPGADQKYLCRYNNELGSIAVFFSQADRVVGFALTVHHEDPLAQAWKLWRDDILRQLGAPTKEVNNPDEWTIKQSEWVFADTKGKKLERVRLTALINDDIAINLEDYEAGL